MVTPEHIYIIYIYQSHASYGVIFFSNRISGSELQGQQLQSTSAQRRGAPGPQPGQDAVIKPSWVGNIQKGAS